VSSVSWQKVHVAECQQDPSYVIPVIKVFGINANQSWRVLSSVGLYSDLRGYPETIVRDSMADLLPDFAAFFLRDEKHPLETG